MKDERRAKIQIAVADERTGEDGESMKRNTLIVVAIVLALALIALVVQMTRYQIVEVNGRAYKLDRLTGKTYRQTTVPDLGFKEVPNMEK